MWRFYAQETRIGEKWPVPAILAVSSKMAGPGEEITRAPEQDRSIPKPLKPTGEKQWHLKN
jgi:hypothetical protein